MSLRRLLRRVRREEGYSLIEMLTVMAIMGVVMSSLTTVFVTASNSETDMNNRYQAQLTARLALDTMRREVHCAKVATPANAGATSSVTLTLSWTQSDGTTFNCKTGSGFVTWCTRNVATNRYALYRVVGSTCSGGVNWGDFLVLQRRSDGLRQPDGTLHLHVHRAVDQLLGQAARRHPGERQAGEDRRAV